MSKVWIYNWVCQWTVLGSVQRFLDVLKRWPFPRIFENIAHRGFPVRHTSHTQQITRLSHASCDKSEAHSTVIKRQTCCKFTIIFTFFKLSNLEHQTCVQILYKSNNTGAFPNVADIGNFACFPLISMYVFSPLYPHVCTATMVCLIDIANNVSRHSELYHQYIDYGSAQTYEYMTNTIFWSFVHSAWPHTTDGPSGRTVAMK